MTTLEEPQRRAPVVLARAPAFRLGEVEVRPATREVIGPGGRQVAEPKVMQMLVALHDAKGEILSREDLSDTCWEGRIVGQDAINRVVSRLRHLGETVGGGAFGVETIVKVGYRLTTGPSAATPAPLDAPAPARPDRRLLIGAGAGAAVAASAGAWLWLQRAAQPSEAARQLHRQGVEAARLGTAEGTAQGIGFLQQAVALEPDYADAWGALSLAYQASLHFQSDEAARQVEQRAVAAAHRARELDPGNVRARATQALLIPPYGNWLASETALRQVLDLEPAQFETCAILSRVLASVGRGREGLAILDRIEDQTRLQPAMQYWRAFMLWFNGRVEEADAVLDRAIGLWPRSYQVWFTRFWIYARTGRADAALAMSADASDRPPGIPDWNFELINQTARALASRAPADIETAMATNLKHAREGAGFAENAIEFAADVGRLDDAFAVADAYYFSRGFAVGAARYSVQQASYTRPKRRQTHFLFNPTFARMRADPRFAALADDLGLTAYWKASGAQPDVGWPPTR